MSLTVSSFFRYYMFHPIDAPREKDRWAALLTTIAVGILSAGLIHVICAATVYNGKFFQKYVQRDKVEKATEVFNKTVNHRKPESSRIETDDSEKKKNAGEFERMLRKGEKLDIWVDLIIEGADKGDKDFQYLLAKIYKKGEGLEKSDENAFLWFRQAAKQGHVKAQYHLAAMYHVGKGIGEPSLQKAAKWYKRAAEGGDSRAQFSIGSMYHHGTGVDKYLKDAAEWYKLSALKGNDKAMNNLGVMYYNGEGVTESNDRAIYWLKKAAQLGNKSASKNLEDILEAQQNT